MGIDLAEADNILVKALVESHIASLLKQQTTLKALQEFKAAGQLDESITHIREVVLPKFTAQLDMLTEARQATEEAKAPEKVGTQKVLPLVKPKPGTPAKKDERLRRTRGKADASKDATKKDEKKGKGATSEKTEKTDGTEPAEGGTPAPDLR